MVLAGISAEPCVATANAARPSMAVQEVSRMLPQSPCIRRPTPAGSITKASGTTKAGNV